jgi:hypothetical protein
MLLIVSNYFMIRIVYSILRKSFKYFDLATIDLFNTLRGMVWNV